MQYTSGMVQTNPWTAFRAALFSIAAVLAAFLAMYGLCVKLGHDPSPAVLAAALTVGLMRRPERATPAGLSAKLAMLPLIAMTAGLIGMLFHALPLAGAALFTCAVAVSVWLRNFGERGAAAGGVIALSFMAILVVPVRPGTGAERVTTAVLVVLAGVFAFLIAAVFARLSSRAGVVSESSSSRLQRRRVREGAMPPATRGALQMFAALAFAFACGLTIFHQHWPWVVLSSFIVTSGAMGRGDAVYKALLRFGGAAGGTLCALFIAQIHFPNSTGYATAIFGVLFLGIWLRQINYVYWAAGATLIFALLQGTQGASLPLFGIRVLCIAAGALCGIAATWFVYPVHTENVVRLRVAEALGALREILAAHAAGELHESHWETVRHHEAQLSRVAPPVRLHRAVFGAADADAHPAALIERMRELLRHLRDPGLDRRDVGGEMRRIGEILKRRSERVRADGRMPEPPSGTDKV